MATFTGTAGNNLLTGGAANDLLLGLAGNDTLDGGAGNDTMNGAVGNDVFVVNSFGDQIVEAFNGGTDTVRTALLDPLGIFSLAPYTYVENLAFTGTVAAILKGNSFNNAILANSAAATADTLYGAGGNDTLAGFGGNDSLMGGSGDDSLDGGVGTDMLIGGFGNDTYVIDALADRAFEYGFGGFDTIRSVVQKDLRLSWTQQIEGLTYTGAAVATLHGNGLGNAITSLAATNETLNGYAGNDTLDGGGGTDSMLGGLGDDQYMVSTTDLVSELAGQGTDTFVGAKTSIGVAPFSTTIENLFYTGSSAVAVSGNALNNVVSGGSGNNTVSGLDGNDTLFGGGGADSLVGANGDDVFYGGSVSGFNAFSALTPDTAIDTLVGGLGNDLYWIDNLADVVTELAAGGTRDVVLSNIDNSLARYANVEALVLRNGSDAWYGAGGAANDIIVGNNGDNYLTGGAGNDTLSGNVDFVNFFTAQASDVLEGGAGNDVLVGFAYQGSGSYFFFQEQSFFGGLGDDLYVLGANPSGVGGLDTGGTDTAVLLGSGSIAALEGVEHIVMYGAGGADDTRALAAVNAVYAAANNGAAYTGLLGTAIEATGNDLGNRITGNSQTNKLWGMAGADTITGGLGNDSLDGGLGVDSLTGGSGDDWYFVDAGDVVVEAAAQGFDIVSSATLTTYAAFANVDGLQYSGASAVTLGNAPGNVSNDFFGGGTGNDTINGYGGNDTLDGGAGNDSIDGGIGVDSLDGGVGNDTVLGQAGTDSIDGAEGNDSLLGGDDNDTILGGLGLDTVNGGAGNDVLYAGENTFFVSDTSGSLMLGGDGNDTLSGALGADTLSGDAGNDSLIGGEGSDLLSGGAQLNSGNAFSATGDVLWGGAAFALPNATPDTFQLAAPTVANKAIETFVGSSTFYFNTGTMIADFGAGSDTIRIASSVVGDNDATLENAAVQAAPGAFSSTAELVIFRTDAVATFNSGAFLFGFDAAAILTVIGSANAAFATGAERIFVVDNGNSSAIVQFTSANADALVTTDELALLAVVNGNANLELVGFGLF